MDFSVRAKSAAAFSPVIDTQDSNPSTTQAHDRPDSSWRLRRHRPLSWAFRAGRTGDPAV